MAQSFSEFASQGDVFQMISIRIPYFSGVQDHGIRTREGIGVGFSAALFVIVLVSFLLVLHFEHLHTMAPETNLGKKTQGEVIPKEGENT